MHLIVTMSYILVSIALASFLLWNSSHRRSLKFESCLPVGETSETWGSLTHSTGLGISVLPPQNDVSTRWIKAGGARWCLNLKDAFKQEHCSIGSAHSFPYWGSCFLLRISFLGNRCKALSTCSVLRSSRCELHHTLRWKTTGNAFRVLVTLQSTHFSPGDPQVTSVSREKAKRSATWAKWLNPLVSLRFGSIRAQSSSYKRVRLLILKAWFFPSIIIWKTNLSVKILTQQTAP